MKHFSSISKLNCVAKADYISVEEGREMSRNLIIALLVELLTGIGKRPLV